MHCIYMAFLAIRTLKSYLLVPVMETDSDLCQV
jgi:hypothetical protein